MKTNSQILREVVSQKAVNAVVESVDDIDSATGAVTGKNLYMRGIFIQGGIRNANQRIYPVSEIARAVRSLKEKIDGDYSIFGELSHPEGLNINEDRISHVITDIWQEGPNGLGKLRVLPTPMGNIAKVILDCKLKLGVSSRGSGNVNEATGEVSDFDIVTVDIVSQPSAPGSYPTPIYEQLMNTRGGYHAFGLARDMTHDSRAQKFLKEEIIKIIKGL